jgi:hypothetical protein
LPYRHNREVSDRLRTSLRPSMSLHR